jgi:hypothetical protein
MAHELGHILAAMNGMQFLTERNRESAVSFENDYRTVRNCGPRESERTTPGPCQ